MVYQIAATSNTLLTKPTILFTYIYGKLPSTVRAEYIDYFIQHWQNTFVLLQHITPTKTQTNPKYMIFIQQ